MNGARCIRKKSQSVTEVHVVRLRPLGEGDPLVNGVQQFVFDLRHRVTVENLHRHLRPGLAFRRDAHQRLGHADRHTDGGKVSILMKV